MRRSLEAALVLLSMSLVGCLTSPPTGMAGHPARPSPSQPFLDEVARVDPPSDSRALLVAHPRTACSGSARTIFINPDGTFLGAIAPGQAALLTIPRRTRTVIAVSSIEITASPGRWFGIDEVVVPAAPAGLLLRTVRRDARQCGSGSYANAVVATKPEIEEALADAEIEWLDPRPREGQAWLDAHRERVDELLGLAKTKQPTVGHRVRVP